MSLPPSDLSVQQSLMNSAAAFYDQKRIEGFEEFHNVCCNSKQAEFGVYGKLWEVLEKPTGNLEFGRQAFYDVEGQRSTLPQKADAIVRYMASFIPTNLSTQTTSERTVSSVQRNNEEDLTLDPITYAQMTDPVIDQLGHTFDRTTIDALVANTREGEPLHCPLGREIIDVNRLVPNIFARDAIERNQNTNALSIRNPQLDGQNDGTLSSQMMNEITQFIRDAAMDRQRTQRTIDGLVSEVRVMRKQIQNIATMSTADKFKIAFGPLLFKPNHLEIVMNRNVPQQSQLTLPSSRNRIRTNVGNFVGSLRYTTQYFLNGTIHHNQN